MNVTALDDVAARERLLLACGWRETRKPKCLIFVAHPDDETIGFGGHLRLMPDLAIVHATDGAPADGTDARAKGFSGAASYAAARRRELAQAMRLAGLDDRALAPLGFQDQQTTRRLMELTRAFLACVETRRPDLIFTHAREGGHPDHDAVAFAARAAARLARDFAPPRVVEAPFYCSEKGVELRQSFPAGAHPAAVIGLAPDCAERKRRLLDCFQTQRETLAPFHAEFESFREAETEDFTRAPGETLYDRRDWNCTGEQFARRCREALAGLGLPPCL